MRTLGKNVNECRSVLVNLTLFNELNQHSYIRCSSNSQTRITETLPTAMYFHEMPRLKIDAHTFSNIKSQGKALKWISDTWESPVGLCDAGAQNHTMTHRSYWVFTHWRTSGSSWCLCSPSLLLKSSCWTASFAAVTDCFLDKGWRRKEVSDRERSSARQGIYCACAESERRLHWMSEINHAFIQCSFNQIMHIYVILGGHQGILVFFLFLCLYE